MRKSNRKKKEEEKKEKAIQPVTTIHPQGNPMQPVYVPGVGPVWNYPVPKEKEIDDEDSVGIDMEEMVGFEPYTHVTSLRVFLKIFCGLLVLIATVWRGMPATIVAFFSLGILYLLLDNYLSAWEDREILKQYAKRKENIYECSTHPGDRLVHKRAEEHRRLLWKSGNQLKVVVHEFYFQDYSNPNETWQYFMLGRVYQFILSDRKNRHGKMSASDREKYKTYFLDQDME